MVRLILLSALFAVGMYFYSAWRMKAELRRNATPLRDPLLEPVLGRIARALGLERIPVNIYEIDAINGLASPDGRVFITRGFFEKYRSGQVSADEIASVVAHELGHVALGHSRRRLFDFTGANAVRTGLALVLGRFVPFVGLWVAELVARVLQMALSRSDEYEADEYAAALLIKSGIGTRPQVSLLAKLDRMSGAAGRPPAWLASHPETAARIRAIRAAEARWFGA